MRGATCSARFRPMDIRNFNPRAPCGARHLALSYNYLIVKFQSTRPMRGATSVIYPTNPFVRISIHAPHAGRDLDGVCAYLRNYIFQSTRPMRGATMYDRFYTYGALFQSTRPMRGATFMISISLRVVLISIHAPHAGRDVNLYHDDKHDYISIHAPHAGRDLNLMELLLELEKFQSTRPMRGATQLQFAD